VPRLVPVGTRPVSVPETFSERDEAAAGSSQRTVAWIVGGAGAVLLATAGVFAGLAASKNRDSKEDCDPENANRCGTAGVQLREDARSFANLATIAGVLGGVGLAGGVVLYLSAPEGEAAPGEALIVGVRGAL
jgi:hypothetical protein